MRTWLALTLIAAAIFPAFSAAAEKSDSQLQLFGMCTNVERTAARFRDATLSPSWQAYPQLYAALLDDNLEDMVRQLQEMLPMPPIPGEPAEEAGGQKKSNPALEARKQQFETYLRVAIPQTILEIPSLIGRVFHSANLPAELTPVYRANLRDRSPIGQLAGALGRVAQTIHFDRSIECDDTETFTPSTTVTPGMLTYSVAAVDAMQRALSLATQALDPQWNQARHKLIPLEYLPWSLLNQLSEASEELDADLGKVKRPKTAASRKLIDDQRMGLLKEHKLKTLALPAAIAAAKDDVTRDRLFMDGLTYYLVLRDQIREKLKRIEHDVNAVRSKYNLPSEEFDEAEPANSAGARAVAQAEALAKQKRKTVLTGLPWTPVELGTTLGAFVRAMPVNKAFCPKILQLEAAHGIRAPERGLSQLAKQVAPKLAATIGQCHEPPKLGDADYEYTAESEAEAEAAADAEMPEEPVRSEGDPESSLKRVCLGSAADLVAGFTGLPLPKDHQERNAFIEQNFKSVLQWQEGACQPTSLIASMPAEMSEKDRVASLAVGMARYAQRAALTETDPATRDAAIAARLRESWQMLSASIQNPLLLLDAAETLTNVIYAYGGAGANSVLTFLTSQASRDARNDILGDVATRVAAVDPDLPELKAWERNAARWEVANKMLHERLPSDQLPYLISASVSQTTDAFYAWLVGQREEQRMDFHFGQLPSSTLTSYTVDRGSETFVAPMDGAAELLRIIGTLGGLSQMKVEISACRLMDLYLLDEDEN